MMVFTHLLLEARSKYSQNLKPYSRTHDILDSVEGFSHIAFNYNTFPPIRIKTKPMIFILKRKEMKLKYMENEETELSTDTEEVPFDADILKTDIDQDLTSETENVLEVGGIDETLELGDEISQLLNDMDDDIFVRSVIHDNEEDEHIESPLIDLNIEPTEDIEEEVQLSKLMRMSREDLIKELNRAQNKAKIYPKSGTVKSNIKKIIREYKALEDGKRVKAEDSTYADLPPDEKVKHNEYVRVHEAEFSTVSEENYSDIHAKSEQVAKKPVLEKYVETDIQQNTDPVEMETEISSLPPENLTHEEHHDRVPENGKKAIKKIIEKYKVLDQSMDEEASMVVDNITVQRKKPIQKIRPAKQIFQKDVLQQETEDLEKTREPKKMSVSTENQTIENESTEKKGGKKTKKDTNEIILEFNNDVTNRNENLKNSESGTTENQPHLQISKTKKAGKKVLKEADEEHDAEISTAELTAYVPDEETPMSKIRRKTVVRNLKKEKFIKASDDIYHTPLSSNHGSNEDQTDKLNAADAHEQENDMPTPDSKDTVSEYEVQETSAQETTAVKNEIGGQEDEKVSDEINPKISTKYSAQPPKRSVKEINKLTKQIMKDAVDPDELPFEDLTGPEKLPPTEKSIMVDDEITPISESREDIKLPKALTQDTETIQDEHRTENDETVEYEDIAKSKLDEVIPM